MKTESMIEKMANSFLSGASQSYIENLYDAYLADPQAVSAEWQACFEQLPLVNGGLQEVSHAAIIDYFKHLKPQAAPTTSDAKEVKVLQLVNAYRRHGHYRAALDPLNLAKQHPAPTLDLNYHGLSEQDLGSNFSVPELTAGKAMTLSDIIRLLDKTYCHHIGFEYGYIGNHDEVLWLREAIESRQGHGDYCAAEQKTILAQLAHADGLERYIAKKYVAQKRFSLEGGDALIPLLTGLVQRAGSDTVKETVIGMAHRGRLNVLINVFGKSPAELFREFEGKLHDEAISGDVKYHLGFSSDVATPGGVMHMALAFNPSHLAIISPVVEGSVRARQIRRGDSQREQVLPILIHGDAAFAGQGVIMETLNMSQTRGFNTGGTIHVVINNQVGFTTSRPEDARSTFYCSDSMKMIDAPVFHVNGDDPEAVLFVTELAFAYRQKFHKDVLIDLVCYRRHGHNEADEPAATQPMMYKTIKKHSTPYQLYSEKLLAAGVVNDDDIKQISDQYRQLVDSGQPVIEQAKNGGNPYLVDWQPYLNQSWQQKVKTAISPKAFKQLAAQMIAVPEDYKLQPQVAREMKNRQAMAAGELPINWGFAEVLAYAGLLTETHSIRLCGQDSGRGTFSHRHAVLHQFETGEDYIPLQHLSADQGCFTVIDSLLSEEAVLGFEYGYATAEPKTMVIWEAQFGDFANGAQVVIDQFLSSGEQKWGRLCGLTMLLPHGYEGMGPEHSSARLERYLQLCAQQNMQVCMPTTPAQAFHMLRRQMLRPYRKPLIVMTPKSLLRHKLAVSTIEDFTQGHFQLVIPDVDKPTPNKVKKVIFCSGKVYYELLQQRREQERDDVAIVRIEQLYPMSEEDVAAQLKLYKAAKDIVWCQEEPKNQGAWYFIRPQLEELFNGQQLRYAGRERSASPAEGSPLLHKQRQEALVEDALHG